MITHYRVDMRVVHGQTTMILKKVYPMNGIMIIDDEISKDKFMVNLYKSTLPSDIKMFVYPVERALDVLKKAEDSQTKYFAIFKDPITVAKVVENGYQIKGSLIIGQQFIRENAPRYMKSLGSTPEEWAAIEYLHNKGVEVLFDPSCIFENKSFEEVKKLHDEAVENGVTKGD